MNVISNWGVISYNSHESLHSLSDPDSSPLPYCRHHAGLPSSPSGKQVQGEKHVTGTILAVACPQAASYIISKYLI